MDYLYDGTFEGLLCCIYAHYYEEKADGIFRREIYQQNMLCRSAVIETDGDKASRVYDAVRKKISSEALRRIYAVWLSEEPEKEIKILRYVVMGFRLGGRVNLLHGDPVVFEVQQAEKKVYAERHRYLGILRFSVITAAGPIDLDSFDLDARDRATQSAQNNSEQNGRGHSGQNAGSCAGLNAGRGSVLDGTVWGEDGEEVLYARLEPDNDIVELMAPHFADRYKNDPFILHDLRREKAVFAQGGHWYSAALPRDAVSTLAQGEREYRKLWKQYFETIAIKERTNPRCQKQYMPVRYWKHLTELQE